MSVRTLCSTLRRITIAARCYSTQLVKDYGAAPMSNLLVSKYPTVYRRDSEMQIKFVPRTLNIDFDVPLHDGIRRSIVEIPLRKRPDLKEPIERDLPYEDASIITNKSLELPTMTNVLEKLSKKREHLITIRRKKMKKHKLRKLRKRMSVIWAKLRLRRSVKREKEFQAELLAKIEEAEKFDAKAYVQSRLDLLHKTRLPMTWRGELLPKSMIMQLIKDNNERKRKLQDKPELDL